MGSNRYQDRWESPPYFYLAFFINAALLHVNDAKRLYMIKYCNYLSVNFCKKPCKNMKKNIKKRYWEINILATSKNIKDIFPIILPQLCPLTKEKVKKKNINIVIIKISLLRIFYFYLRLYRRRNWLFVAGRVQKNMIRDWIQNCSNPAMTELHCEKNKEIKKIKKIKPLCLPNLAVLTN